MSVRREPRRRESIAQRVQFVQGVKKRRTYFSVRVCTETSKCSGRLLLSDEPEVSAEFPVVHGGIGHSAELSCLVYADPNAEVIWYRETMRLDPNGQRYMESRGSRHTLIVRKVEQQDFANYSCYAVNLLGKARAYLTLRGK